MMPIAFYNSKFKNKSAIEISSSNTSHYNSVTYKHGLYKITIYICFYFNQLQCHVMQMRRAQGPVLRSGVTESEKCAVLFFLKENVNV